MKKIKIFNRRRYFIDNDQGVIGMLIMLLLLIIGGIFLLSMLSQAIIPLMLLIILVVVTSVAVKWVFRVRMPTYVGQTAARYGKSAVGYGEKGIKAGASWFDRILR